MVLCCAWQRERPGPGVGPDQTEVDDPIRDLPGFGQFNDKGWQMKNEKGKLSGLQFLAILLLSFGLFFSGCSGGGSNENSADGGKSSDHNSLTYQGSTAALNHLYLVGWGPYGDGYSVDIYITSSDLNPDNFPPQEGRYIYLEMYFPNDFVTPGTYIWSNEYPPPAGILSDHAGITVVGNGRESWHELTGGSVSIEQSGANYIITGNMTTADGPATFSYIGPLTASWDKLEQ
jgi:hypothetical protein